VRDILGEDGPPADYRAVPRVTFTDSEIRAVGLTVAQARDAGLRVAVGLARVPSSARGWDPQGRQRRLHQARRRRRTRCVGRRYFDRPTASEVLSALAVAVHAQVNVDTLRHMIYAYPTFHRGIEDALRHLG
jgi:pyruvate/2-oxoglutarate dehydrogenase complex dihydrolipoamide dehydrogenase (E3) component